MTNETDPKNEMDRQILEAIDIEVPAADAYAQWTQFEAFPHFMDNVTSVEQIDDRRLRWTVSFLGSEQKWRAEITEQIPGKRVAWRSVHGAEHGGVVTFHRVSDDRCRVTVQIDYSPQTLVENLGDLLGVVSRGVRRALEDFKAFVESRDRPTGVWPGRLAAPDERTRPPEAAALPTSRSGALGRS